MTVGVHSYQVECKLNQYVTQLAHAAILKAVDAGESVNEVEGAGNTPLHNAAYEGWLEGVELLISLGAKARLPPLSAEQIYIDSSSYGVLHMTLILLWPGECQQQCWRSAVALGKEHGT